MVTEATSKSARIFKAFTIITAAAGFSLEREREKEKEEKKKQNFRRRVKKNTNNKKKRKIILIRNKTNINKLEDKYNKRSIAQSFAETRSALRNVTLARSNAGEKRVSYFPKHEKIRRHRLSVLLGIHTNPGIHNVHMCNE